MRKILSVLLTVLMIVSVLPMQLFAAGGEEVSTLQSSTTENQNQASGVIYTKTSTANSDGTVSITLTAHTTGEVRQTTSVSPTDIVLVLDVSGSMDENYTTTVVTGYEEADLGTYEYYTIDGWFLIFPIVGTNTAYGDGGDDEHYVKLADGTYIEVTYNGRDANNFDMYEYTLGTNGIIVYPELSVTPDTAREHNYDVVQLYTVATESQTVNKMQLLKDAVNSFIDTTAAMNTGLEASQMHTISIVKFADDSYYNSTTPTVTEGNHKNSSDYNYSEVVKNLTPVDATGADELKTAVNSLTPGGATAVDYGLNLAEAVLMSRSIVADESAVDRNEVIVVFTDGEPNHQNGFDDAVANSAILTAGNMESQAGVEVYGVCIASGADATDLSADINKFMHYMSSNYPTATSMSSPVSGCDTSAGYYMTPDESTSLSMIFESIIEEIDHPTVTLGEEATIVDTISPYFDFSGDVSDVVLMTSDRTPQGDWADPVVDTSLTATVVGDRIAVTGFDFDANYISAKGRGEDGLFYGRRLIISFNIVPDYGVIDAASATLTDGVLPTNTIASLVDSNSALVAETSTPKLSTHTVTYKDGDRVIAEYDRLAGSEITVDSAPAKTGYTFGGWSYPTGLTVSGGKFKMPDSDVVITANFTKNTYNVTYVISDYNPGATVPDAVNDVPYNDEFTVSAKDMTVEGYTFSGWSLQDGGVITDGKFNMPAYNVTLVGTYERVGVVTFTVNHHLETLTDGVYAFDEGGTYTARVGTSAVADPKSYTGFVLNTEKTGDLTKAVTSESNPIVFNLYYDRIDSKVTYLYTGDVPPADILPELTAETVYPYGDTVTVADNVYVPGYIFEGWTSTTVSAVAGETFTMPAISVVFTGEFSKRLDVAYTVKYYFMDSDESGALLDTYTEDTDRRVTGEGVLGENVTATVLTVPGFSHNAEKSRLSGEIAVDASGNGTLVLEVYYDRETYSVKYVYATTPPDAAPPLPATKTYAFGTDVAVADKLADITGYSFDGWLVSPAVDHADGTFTMPASDVTFYGRYEPTVGGVIYHEYHYIQKLNGEYDEVDPYDYHVHTGTVGERAEEDAFVITGFTFNSEISVTSVDQLSADDANNVLEFYYDRNKHSVEYKITGTHNTDAEVPAKAENILFESQVDVSDMDMAIPGYIFSGWTVNGTDIETVDADTFYMPDRDVVIEGSYSLDPNTEYTVKYYFEDLSGTYVEDQTLTHTHTAVPGAPVSATEISRAGYTIDRAHMDATPSGSVLHDGSLVLDLYYKLNTYKIYYSVAGNIPENFDVSTDVPVDSGEYKYGAIGIQLKGKPDMTEYPNYNFAGWIVSTSQGEEAVAVTADNKLEKMPARDVYLLGHFSAKDEIPYMVQHWQQTEDLSEYKIHESNVGHGKDNAEITIVANNYPGFGQAMDKPTGGTEVATLTGLIDADNMLIINFYYPRNTYDVTYTYAGMAPVGAPVVPAAQTDVPFGKDITVAETPAVPGYTFVGWTTDDVTVTDGKFDMPDNDVAFEGSFTSNLVKYKVEYYQQNLTDDDYTKVEADCYEAEGYTGQNITAKSVSYVGFTLVNAADATKHITVDENGVGNLVIQLYYDRHTYDITYGYYGTQPIADDKLPSLPVTVENVKYGTPAIAVAEKLVLEGYTFDGWYTRTADVADGKFTMPNHDVAFLGRFFLGRFLDGTEYTIKHYTQNLDGTYSDGTDGGEDKPYETMLSAGTTGDTASADPLTITGFTYAPSISTAEAVITANGLMTLKLYYTRDAHKVTYIYNGVVPTGAPAVPVATVDVPFGTSVLVAAAPALSGFTFSGWTTADATIEGGKFTMPDKDVVLVGSFAKNPDSVNPSPTRYTLTYHSNGGTTYPNERHVSGTVVALDKVPVKDGYTFAGWFADEALTEKITSVTMNKNKDVYAGWNYITRPEHPIPEDLNGEDHFAYVIGYPDGTVRPMAYITRAEVTSILFRLLKDEVRDANLTEVNAYTDIAKGSWYNKAVSTLTAMDIVHGRTETEFMPDAWITRAEFAAFCARFEDTVIDVGDDIYFTDIGDHWAENEIRVAAARGWVEGYEDQTFRPEQPITRAEAMTLINRVLCRVPETPDDLLDGMTVWPDNADETVWYYLAVQEATNSHTYNYKDEVYEKWLELAKNPDWMEYHD